jgi:2,4-dienoyl-CoA reductase-like NADH-dependent reductase (Old Yellow Enzyme family)
MVTGGFRTRTGMRNAITSQSCDLVGLARPAVLEPFCPKMKILNKDVGEDEARVVVPVLKANGVMKWLGLESLVSAKVTVSLLSG